MQQAVFTHLGTRETRLSELVPALSVCSNLQIGRIPCTETHRLLGMRGCTVSNYLITTCKRAYQKNRTHQHKDYTLNTCTAQSAPFDESVW